MLARKGSSALLREFGSTHATANRPSTSLAMRCRSRSCRPPCLNGSPSTSPTCGIARYTGATHGTAATAIVSPRACRRRSSGSVITASPIHCGAMTSVRVKGCQSRSMSPAPMLAGPELVHRAAIRALRLARARHIEVDARMVVPDLHAVHGARAEHAAVGVQVLGGQLDDGILAGGVVHHQTFVSQWAYLGLRPFTMSKKADWIFSVTGPREPMPISSRSSSRIGVTSAAVPVKKASSLM